MLFQSSYIVASDTLMVQQNSCEGSWIQTVSVPSFLPRDCKLDGAGTLVRAIVRGEGLIPPTEKSFPWAGKKKNNQGLYLLQSLSAPEILLWYHGQAVLSFFVMWCVPTEVSSQQPQAVRGHFCAFEVTIAQATASA